jgi:hypothetical protein
MKMLEIDAVGMYDTAAEEMGKVFVTTELGGGGTATAQSAAIARSAGVANVLKACRRPGKGALETTPNPWLDMPDGRLLLLRRGRRADRTGLRSRRRRKERRGRCPDLSHRPHRRTAAGGEGENGRHSHGPPFPRPREVRRLRQRPGGGRSLIPSGLQGEWRALTKRASPAVGDAGGFRLLLAAYRAEVFQRTASETLTSSSAAAMMTPTKA